MHNHTELILEELDKQPKELIAIVGPTCTGKTDLSLDLAEKLDIPIINADSRLIFNNMNIGTAKPNLHELARATHHLIDIKEPDQSYSAGDYQKDFDKKIAELRKDAPANKPLAIVVGGTGLYLRTALENLEMPEVSRDDELRAELNAKTLDELLIELENLDPEAHLDIDAKNKVRVVRAIEIVKITGKALKESRGKSSEPRYKVAYYGLNFHKRRSLYDLINQRVIKMINKGLIHEVEGLRDKYGETKTLNSTIGYREVISYFNKEYSSISEARRAIQKNTRLYAKRQLTWFKNNPEIKWLFRD